MKKNLSDAPSLRESPIPRQSLGRKWSWLELERARWNQSYRWFAWRPVKLEDGGWAWLRLVERSIWSMRCGDAYFPEWSTYALLP